MSRKIDEFTSVMTNYEKARLFIQVVQLLLTLPIPFIVVWFSRYLDGK